MYNRIAEFKGIFDRLDEELIRGYETITLGKKYFLSDLLLEVEIWKREKRSPSTTRWDVLQTLSWIFILSSILMIMDKEYPVGLVPGLFMILLGVVAILLVQKKISKVKREIERRGEIWREVERFLSICRGIPSIFTSGKWRVTRQHLIDDLTGARAGLLGARQIVDRVRSQATLNIEELSGSLFVFETHGRNFFRVRQSVECFLGKDIPNDEDLVKAVDEMYTQNKREMVR